MYKCDVCKRPALTKEDSKTLCAKHWMEKVAPTWKPTPKVAFNVKSTT